MKRKHILLAGLGSENRVPISMMLESFNHKISILTESENLWEKIKYSKKNCNKIELMILGSDFSEGQLLDLFNSLADPDDSPPFIIISDTEKLELMNHLLDRGFYGYLVNPADTMMLGKQVNTIFFNIKKYKKNEK